MRGLPFWRGRTPGCAAPPERKSAPGPLASWCADLDLRRRPRTPPVCGPVVCAKRALDRHHRHMNACPRSPGRATDAGTRPSRQVGDGDGRSGIGGVPSGGLSMRELGDMRFPCSTLCPPPHRDSKRPVGGHRVVRRGVHARCRVVRMEPTSTRACGTTRTRVVVANCHHHVTCASSQTTTFPLVSTAERTNGTIMVRPNWHDHTTCTNAPAPAR